MLKALNYRPRTWRIWFYFPVWVRIQVPSRCYNGRTTEAWDGPIWKAPFIWIREWWRWRR